VEKKLAEIILTFFGVGKIPFAQGTFASAITATLYYFALSGKLKLEILTTLSTLIISLLLTKYIKVIWKGKDDPSEVVIDEVLGMMLSMFALPKRPEIAIAGFLLFRFLDITKIPPINFFDRMKSPYGVMLDDIVGGIMTNIILKIAISIFSEF
jgi:phosphatidylglycerophosphatase A